jgi:hypothetical protein
MRLTSRGPSGAIWRAWLDCAVLWALLGMLPSVAAQGIETNIEAKCTSPYYKPKPAAGKCEPDQEKISALTKATCVGPGITFKGEKCVPSEKAPAPECGDVLPDLVLKDGKCVVDRKVPRSATADYVGDCFEIYARTADGDTAGYPSDTTVKVLSQRALGEFDRSLTVAPADRGFLSCDVRKDSVATTVKASELIEIGAKRVGWAYGVLALPFKYYAHDKSFGSGLSLGPYIGRRWGTPGSAYTFALAATIGTVKGEVRDAQGNITSTPDLQAYSYAAGFMWDISKAQNIKPFKVGVFVGRDLVGSDDVVKFDNNRKTWIAFQIGFDFTDN